MSDFVPLHIISGYSILQSGLTTQKILLGIKKERFLGAGLTDNGVCFGYPEFAKTLTDNNLKYILGINFIIEGFNVSLFIINETGYGNLLSLLPKKDNLSFEELSKSSSGLLCVLETNHGELKKYFLNNLFSEEINRKKLAKIASYFSDKFYLGVEVISKAGILLANKVREFARNYNYETIAFPRIRYLKQDDAIVINIVNAIANRSKIEEKQAKGFECFLEANKYEKVYSSQEIENTNKVLDLSTFDLFTKRGKMLHYCEENTSTVLKDMCLSSLKNKNLDKNENYVTQLDYELKIIDKLGYSNYFLLTQDYVNWAKNNDILVGPGRGSAAGSLVSFLLNITEIDPLKYTLQFERFLNESRKAMPDIDVDFMDIKRNDVVEYMRKKYGVNKIAKIIAFQTFQSKQALIDIGKIFNYPENHIKFISNKIIDPKLTLIQTYKTNNAFKKLIDSDKYYKEIVSLASKLEGLIRQTTIHAAGIVANNDEIPKKIPVILDDENNLVVQYEHDYLEQQGFLKMDFLSIRNLTVIYYCVKLVNKYFPNDSLSINNIPYDEKEIFDLIKSGKTIGLFQIETAAMRRGIKKIKPNCFNDVVALLALNRPGPMQFIQSFVNRKEGKEKYSFISKDLENILSETYGIIVYQEQINKIAMKMASFSASEADNFRRGVSKKDKEVIASLKKKFVTGSLKNGYKLSDIENVFSSIFRFANYGLNKSHSVAYAVLSCKMAYLKAHYPLQFYISILNVGSSSETKLNDLFAEMKSLGIKIVSPNVNISEKYFAIKDSNLLFPLNEIKNFSNEDIDNILTERKNGKFIDFFDFVSRMHPYKLTASSITHLIDAGALDCFSNSRETLRASILEAIQYAELTYSVDGQLNIGIESIPKPFLINKEDDPLSNLSKEYESIGIMLSSNPLTYKKELIDSLNINSILKEKENDSNFKVCGIITSLKTISTKKGQYMAFANILDEFDSMEIIIFSDIFSEVNEILKTNNIIIVEGVIQNKKEEMSYIAKKISLLGE